MAVVLGLSEVGLGLDLTDNGGSNSTGLLSKLLSKPFSLLNVEVVTEDFIKSGAICDCSGSESYNNVRFV